MADMDAELTAALKLAKGKNMYFAFIPKGNSDGKLLLSKAKILSKDIAEAKREMGGGTPVTGMCTGPFSSMVFEVNKAGSASLGATIKKVAKRDTGLTIVPDIKVAGRGGEEE